jgi:hypothetical protein
LFEDNGRVGLHLSKRSVVSHDDNTLGEVHAAWVIQCTGAIIRTLGQRGLENRHKHRVHLVLLETTLELDVEPSPWQVGFISDEVNTAIHAQGADETSEQGSSTRGDGDTLKPEVRVIDALGIDCTGHGVRGAIRGDLGQESHDGDTIGLRCEGLKRTGLEAVLIEIASFRRIVGRSAHVFPLLSGLI